MQSSIGQTYEAPLAQGREKLYTAGDISKERDTIRQLQERTSWSDAHSQFVQVKANTEG